MPDRNILALGEGQPEQPARRVEGGRDHVAECEIRLDGAVGEIGPALAQLLGVVAPVPRRELEIAALFLDQRLQRRAIGQSPLPRLGPDPPQKAPHRGRRLGHGVLQLVVGEGVVAQQPGIFVAQPHRLGNDSIVVVCVVVVAARDEGAPDLLAQVAPG